MNGSKAWIVGVALVTLPATAWAFAPHASLEEENGLKAFDGSTLELHRTVSWTVPRSKQASWARFEAAWPGWRAQWDVRTAVPLRMFGPGRRYAGAMNDPTVAEAAARAVITAHADLIAPGANDFEVVSNHLDTIHGIRTVGFAQSYGELPVLGGQLSVRFKNDRLYVVASEVVPIFDFTVSKERVAGDELDTKALATIDALVDDVRLRRSAGPAMILPLKVDEAPTRYAVVREVIVDANSPVSRWSVYLDAATAAPIARRQTLLFAAGTLRMNVPLRYPGGLRQDMPAPLTAVVSGNTELFTDANGVLTWPGSGPFSGAMFPVGIDVRVSNAAGSLANFPFNLNDGGVAVWNGSNQEFVAAQLTAYIHGNVAWNYAKGIAPQSPWLTTSRLQATVNINDTCNAFSDGTTINFFRSSSRCDNTARLADVVYHEFGHSFHAQSLIRGVGDFDTPHSEGVADYYSATITNDSGMGRGFFYTNQPLREIDPPNTERVWPDDVTSSPHTTGLIFSGAMWDLRKALIQRFPSREEAVRVTDRLLFATLQRASDIPSTYVEVLAADDDDGDISNGTPNFCEINAAFSLHGLASPELAGPAIGQPEVAGPQVTIPIIERSVDCPSQEVNRIELFWRNRQTPSEQGTIAFSRSAASWEALLPQPADNTVLQYRVQVELADGSEVLYPNNPADPLYEAYFGPVIPLYCTDFERNPFDEGWSSALLSGPDREGADDWQWGPPLGEGGDPSQAFSGNFVIGNDLGEDRFNGEYQRNITNQITSPVIDTQGFEVVRLQFRRWLNVEDGDFDAATVRANGRPVWTNFATGNQGDTHHQDREWRFQDIDLSSALNGSNQVELGFQVNSDGGLEFGGWTIDDLCVVGVNATSLPPPPPPPPACGDGTVDPGEACDDGNRIDGDGCESNCELTEIKITCGDGIVAPTEACDDGNRVNGDGCENDCTITRAPPPPPPPAPLQDDCDADPDTCQLNALGDDGCGCSTASARSSAPAGLWFGLLCVGLVLFRRRWRA